MPYPRAHAIFTSLWVLPSYALVRKPQLIDHAAAGGKTLGSFATAVLPESGPRGADDVAV